MKNKLITVALSGLMLIGSTNGLAMETDNNNNSSILDQALAKSNNLLEQYKKVRTLYIKKRDEHWNQNGFWNCLWNFRLKHFGQFKKLDAAARSVKRQKASVLEKLEKKSSNPYESVYQGIFWGTMLAFSKRAFKKIDSIVDQALAAEAGSTLNYWIEDICDGGKRSGTLKTGGKIAFVSICALGAALPIANMISRLSTSEKDLNTLLANKNNELEKEIKECNEILNS